MQKLLFISALVISTQAQALTLEQSVAEAINHHPRLQQKYASFEAAVRYKKAAVGDYLPQVKLYGGVGYEEVRYNSGQRVDTDLNRTELGVKVSQLLFDGFRTTSEIDRLEFEQEAERFGLISEAENLSLEVATVYLNLVEANRIVGLAERNIEEHKDILKDIILRQNKGLSSESDVAQVKARVATSQSGYLAARNQQMDLQAKYYDLVGQLPVDLYNAKPDFNYVPTSLKLALEQAVKNHPEIDAAINDTQAASSQYEREKSDYWPKLSIELQANKNDNIGGIEGPDEDARAMLMLSYDLYNGGSTNDRAEAAAWQVQQAKSIRQQTEKQVIEGTRLAWNSYEFVGQQRKFYQVNVDQAVQAEQGYQRQFELGRRSLLDVLDAKVEVYLARKNYLSAYYNYHIAAYRLINATGQLIESFRVDTPNQWQEEK
ncbi:TolC family outer membrane protein [Shewanella sp. 1_MG-2023]|uniref:TolC family outer membrane protein n=1 Tax=Shewanella electrodiphila TaxID=934143 RepID=A0ABT0KUN5_9GAMM|nr:MULTISPECIES: TolC family outer membrane protein [Shewanella]MCL1047494.1 TolC family outer membrane protein [Shewanella electrodiphila]MDO6612665.1 TolC family outer membrane protein [Shewanella sp. 7_MG-2023]MDO6772364.1 TolC family outer membrane protein [Shewanella sp. 2_MG-2023]MDO6796562.1 TolC family outer membrane protein [Shewanella sp. 1_MG-2023]PMG73662.1 agglutination protein [Shewanella sp. 10N.286.51.B7]